LEGASPLKPDVLRGTDMVVVRELAGGVVYYASREEPHADGRFGGQTHSPIRETK
jgi:isocitrate/isopropylmalate dehydrogenase